VRITVRVRPGAGRDRVGGSYDGALIVAVAARAVDGKATDAVLRCIADAFAVGRRDVTLVAGARSRTKIVEVAGGRRDTLDRLLRAS
jgi:uncharacterized protein